MALAPHPPIKKYIYCDVMIDSYSDPFRKDMRHLIALLLLLPRVLNGLRGVTVSVPGEYFLARKKGQTKNQVNIDSKLKSLVSTETTEGGYTIKAHQ